jgi:hypothetical protein
MALGREGLVRGKLAVRAPNHPYKGDMSAGSYLAQVEYIAFEENCAYRIKNVHPETTEADIFTMIATAAVRIQNMNAPDAENPTAATKLVLASNLQSFQLHRVFFYMNIAELRLHSDGRRRSRHIRPSNP